MWHQESCFYYITANDFARVKGAVREQLQDFKLVGSDYFSHETNLANITVKEKLQRHSLLLCLFS